MASLNARLLALEGTTDTHAKPLPLVVADDTPDRELARLRAGDREVYRWRDAVELFV